MMKMEKNKPYLAIILIQSIYAGMYLVSKAAFDVGMNTFIFVFYRQAAATLFLLPIAAFFEWITSTLNIYGVALVYTSATLAAATSNCLPVITFFIAVLLRMENVKLRTGPGLAKAAGIALCTAGALTMAFYKGPHLKLFLHHNHLFGHYSQQQQQQQHQHHDLYGPSTNTWIKGVFLMLLCTTLWGFWLVLQARVIECYPSKLLFTTLQCFLSSIQSFIIAIALERDSSQWKLGWNIKLFAVAYCGIVVTGVAFYVIAWVVEKKGPVFVAMSTPLALIITIFCSAFLLGEMISFGSVLGGILLVGGLYSVLWGKSEEQKMNEVEKERLESKEEMSTKSPPTLLV
ncbi:hypothetical protein LguiA_003880 [Lonicera macranthoides]